MRIARKLLDYAVPLGLAATALLDARGIASLVSGTLEAQPSFSPVAQAMASPAPAARVISAAPLLAHDPFDHERATHAADGADDADAVTDPWHAPPCPGVRADVVVGAADPTIAFAALQVRGKRVLRRRGDDAGGMRVLAVGTDRVWLEGGGRTCQARVGAPPRAAEVPGEPSPGLERELAGRVKRLSATEYQLDRSVLDGMLDAQPALLEVKAVPEREGNRVVGVRILGVRAGSPLSMLGLENGDRLETINGLEVASPEKMLEAYARLRGGVTDRVVLRVTRAGRPTEIEYQLR